MHFLFSKKCLFFSDAYTHYVSYILYMKQIQSRYIIISNFVIVPSIILLKFNHLVERQIALMRFALLLHVA